MQGVGFAGFSFHRELLGSVAFASFGVALCAFEVALHRGSHKKVQFLGAGLDPFAGAVAFLGPERLVPVGVGIHHVEVEVGRHHHLGGAVHRHRVGLCRNLVAHHAQKALGLDGYGGAVRQLGGEASGQHPVLHVELAVKVRNLGGVEVDYFAVDTQVDAHVVHGVKDLGKVLGVAVLPPADFGFVGVVHPGDVAAFEVLTAEGLFVVGAVAHAAVAQCEEALAHNVGFGRPRRFDDAPGINLNGGLHSELLVTGC